MLGAFYLCFADILTGSFVLAVIWQPIVALAGFLLRFIADPLRKDHLDHAGTFGGFWSSIFSHLIWACGNCDPAAALSGRADKIWSGIVVPTFRLTIIAAGLAAAGLYWLVNFARLNAYSGGSTGLWCRPWVLI